MGPDPSNPATTPRYYYIYNAHGDVVNLVDASGNSVASYAYDTWGALTSVTESFANGWTNPYRYDGRDGVRYDASDGLYWMSVRAYDPTLGRFISHDPLGRTPLFFADQPYAYAGNNPVSNVDPSGQYRAAGDGSTQRESAKRTNRMMARIAKKRGCGKACQARRQKEAQQARLSRARAIARAAAAYFSSEVAWSGLTNPVGPGEDIIQQLLDGGAASLAAFGVSMSEYSFLFAGIAAFIAAVVAAGASVFGAVGAGVLAYKFVALLAEWAFQIELTKDDAFWLSAQDMNSFRAWSLIIIGTIVAVLASVATAFVFIWGPASPLSLMLVGVVAGLAYGIVEVWAQMSKYFDNEDRVFDYPEPN